ncbi:MAG: hypothetical protein ACJ0GZ_03325 [Alphaproteobacteria bacterium]
MPKIVYQVVSIYMFQIFIQMIFFVNLQGVAISSGSACASAGKKASNVLQAIGISPKVEALSMRICISNKNTKNEIDTAIKNIVSAIDKTK